MRFDNATVLRTSVKALLVAHPDLPQDVWIPRQALHVLSPLGALYGWGEAPSPRRGSVVVEPWFAANPAMQAATEKRLRAAARLAETNRGLAARGSAPTITFAPDQEAGITKILAAMAGPRPEKGPLVLLLDGPAGCGKTSVAQEIARRALRARLISGVQYGAPTGRAARRLAEAGCVGARTLHSLFYRGIAEDEKTGDVAFSQPQSPVGSGELLVVDEASMIGKARTPAGDEKVDLELHDLLLATMPPGSILLYLGDREQLDPIAGTWGPDFDAPTARLETVHRQGAGSPVLTVATELRTTGRWPRDLAPAATPGAPSAAFVHPAEEADLVTWYVERRKAGEDVTMVAFTNALRHRLNALARELLGYDEQGPLVPGDRLLVRRNAHGMGLTNGQLLTVTAAERFDGAAVLAEAIGGQTSERDLDDPILAATYYRVHVAEFTGEDWWLLVPEHLLKADAKEWWAWGKAARKAFNSGRQPRAENYPATDYEGDEAAAARAFLTDLLRYKLASLWLERAVPVNYGECLTCYSAQGSQWRSVGVAVCGALRQKKKAQAEELARLGRYATEADRVRLRGFTRWIYTAVTRASHEVCVFNLADRD